MPSMHDYAGDVAQAVGIAQELIVAVEKATIGNVVAFDPGEGEREVIRRDVALPVDVGKQR